MRLLYLFLLLSLASCVTREVAPSEDAAVDVSREVPWAWATCETDNGHYRVSISRSDTAAVCIVTELVEGRDMSTGKGASDCDSNGCSCAAVLDGKSWEYVWEDGVVPVVECYSVEKRWMPCGCGSRLEFEPGDCLSLE